MAKLLHMLLQMVNVKKGLLFVELALVFLFLLTKLQGFVVRFVMIVFLLKQQDFITMQTC